MACESHTQKMLCLFSPPAGIGLVPSPWVNMHPHTPARNNYDLTNADRLSGGVAQVSPPAGPPPAGPLPAGAALAVAPLPIAPMPLGHLPNPPWGGFLTRVCDDCEQLIQSERFHRAPPVAAPSLAYYAPVHGKWESYPDVACTCIRSLNAHLLHGQTQCYPHLRKIWDKLEKTKDDNDRWLRDIALNTNVRGIKQTVYATKAVKDRRRQNGLWRACRCGAEIPDAAGRPAEAYVCMACEGYVSVVDPTGIQSRYDPIWLGMPALPAYARPILPPSVMKNYRSQKIKMQRKVW